MTHISLMKLKYQGIIAGTLSFPYSNKPRNKKSILLQQSSLAVTRKNGPEISAMSTLQRGKGGFRVSCPTKRVAAGGTPRTNIILSFREKPMSTSANMISQFFA